MSFIIGRGESEDAHQAGHLGGYRALDGSSGAPLYLDLDHPHAIMIVGKRGYGKSYTMGVIAESLSDAEAVAPVIVDPMGQFDTLADLSGDHSVEATVIPDPSVKPATLDPRSWCALLELSPESGAGGLVWQAAQAESTLAEMKDHVEDADAPVTDERAALNHLRLAESWGIFDPEGLSPEELASSEISVVDVSHLDSAPMNAVLRGIAESLYRARVDETIQRLPWLLVDEVHTFFDGVAAPALEQVLTRGRAPGVSFIMATQRPSAVPPVGVSQSDVILAHRLTSGADIDALKQTQPTYMDESLEERMPTDTGEVLIIDDATETVHAANVRERRTPHGGESPQASQLDY